MAANLTSTYSNPCNSELLEFGKVVKKGVQDAGMIAFQTATVGVR
jgi:dihydroxyacid dehydratase/phosphogluconate dehydratase